MLPPDPHTMLQFFTPGPRCEASPLLASLGGKGFMVDRMSARQSATSLFGAQARAGVCPAAFDRGIKQSKMVVIFLKWQLLALYNKILLEGQVINERGMQMSRQAK